MAPKTTQAPLSFLILFWECQRAIASLIGQYCSFIVALILDADYFVHPHRDAHERNQRADLCFARILLSKLQSLDIGVFYNFTHRTWLRLSIKMSQKTYNVSSITEDTVDETSLRKPAWHGNNWWQFTVIQEDAFVDNYIYKRRQHFMNNKDR